MYKTLIEHLRESAEIEQGNNAYRIFAADLMSQAADAIEKLTAERDAAVADLASVGICTFCGHWSGEPQNKCTKKGKCAFEWRGAEGC